MSIDDINASFNSINLDYIFEYVDPLLEWLHEKENSLLDGENISVLPVDTSDDKMNSGEGLDDGGLSPIDDDDGHSSDRGEIRSSSRYGGEYGVPLVDISVIDQNLMEICFLNLGEI
ncbi:hypothetical protein Godav_000053 [Gossypium davidsonii]|uniref:Uncharacterized protein n=1 Tax=Gossypium davidsonii TaxID=34287 RepID=A0A7J8TDI0_GOSDV|nr:hypothetical protein [Gossypium davidsonii]